MAHPSSLKNVWERGCAGRAGEKLELVLPSSPKFGLGFSQAALETLSLRFCTHDPSTSLKLWTRSMIQGQLFPLKMLILTWEAIIKFDRQTRTTQIPLLLRSKLKLMTSRTKNNGLQAPC